MTEENEYEQRKCFICKGRKYSYLGIRQPNNKFTWIKTMCFHCLGKGFLKIKKDNNG